MRDLFNDIAPIDFYLNEINKNISYIDATIYNLDLKHDASKKSSIVNKVKKISEIVSEIKDDIVEYNKSIVEE